MDFHDVILDVLLNVTLCGYDLHGYLATCDFLHVYVPFQDCSHDDEGLEHPDDPNDELHLIDHAVLPLPLRACVFSHLIYVHPPYGIQPLDDVHLYVQLVYAQGVHALLLTYDDALPIDVVSHLVSSPPHDGGVLDEHVSLLHPFSFSVLLPQHAS